MTRNTLPISLLIALALFTCVGLIGTSASAQPVELTQEELDVWNDPGFRKRFAESYIAQTDTEPKPETQAEVEAINATLELMRENKLEEALAMAIEARENPEGKDEKEKKKSRSRSKEDDENQPEVKMSALMDFLIANLQLNIAMNLPQPGEDATEGELQSYTIKRNKFLADAAANYRTATERHAKYLRAWRNLGITYLRMQDFKGARDAFVQVIRLGAAGPDTYGLIGFCHTSLGDHLAAESAFRMANLMQPEKKDWEMGLVRSFLMQKRYHEVVAMTKAMLEDDPTNDRLWLFQSNAFIGMEQFDKAAENYEILAGMGKADAPIMNMLANIYTNQGLFEPAVERYAQAVKLADESQLKSMRGQMLNSARVLSSRGEEARGATKAMIALIKKAYDTQLSDKDLTMLLRLQARIALAEGSDDKQASILEEVVEINPLDGEALILLGQHYTRLQEWDRAIAYLERAANIEGFEADAKVRQAQVYVLSDRAALALPLLREAQQVKPRESVQQYLEAVERMSK